MLRQIMLTSALISASVAHATEATYRCSDSTTFHVTFSPPGTASGSAQLTWGDGTMLTLPQALSADGARYATDEIEFWIKGRGATLTRDGHSVSCDSR
jgi:membrane-bound inhibitor of C-type lysozyme